MVFNGFHVIWAEISAEKGGKREALPAGSPFFASLTSSSSTCTSWSGSSASGPSGPASGGLEHISTPLSSRFMMIYEAVRALASDFGPLRTCIQGTTLCCTPCFALFHGSLYASRHASLYILCLALRLTLCLTPRFTLCSISTFRRSFGNWFDFVLILAGLADIYIIAPMATGGSAARNITMLRLFRATKPLGLGAHGL